MKANGIYTISMTIQFLNKFSTSFWSTNIIDIDKWIGASGSQQNCRLDILDILFIKSQIGIFRCYVFGILQYN